MNQTLKLKCVRFSVKAAQLYKNLLAYKKETVLSELFLKAASTVGAVIARADFSTGKNDRLGKFCTALQGCGEVRYWLEVLKTADYITEFEFNNILRDCEELQNILGAAIKAIRSSAGA
jgi:four helix bundle protein